MRELTEDEKVSLSKMRQDFIKAYGRDELDLVSSALLFAFIAGLASQDSRIAELEQQLKDATDKLERLGFGNYTELSQQLIALSSKFGPLNKVSLVKAARTINPSLGLAEAVSLVRELFGDELNKVVVR